MIGTLLNNINMIDELRIEVRIKNNRLFNAIVPVFGSISEFCRRAGFCNSEVCALINLRMSPFSTTGRNCWAGYKPVAIKLAEICGYSCEDLFPIELYKKLLNNKVIKSMSLKTAIALRDDRTPVDDNYISAEKNIVKNEISKAIDYAISCDRKNKAIRLLYGLGAGGYERTKREVASIFRVSSSRINQIECTVISKLRKPSVAKYIDC